MIGIQLLNNIEHKQLQVLSAEHSERFGDNINQALVFSTEFAELQREYPIFFTKDANGSYQSVALMGLDKDENLFLDENGWQARYIPAVRQSGPFKLGFQNKHKQNAEPLKDPVIHVDMDHPRISTREGEPVFLRHGGNSPYLENIITVLQRVNQGIEATRPMFAAFSEADIIEPISIEVMLDEVTRYALPGFYTIDVERFDNLAAEAISRLHESGFLRCAVHVMSSVSNVNRLIELKNKKRFAA